LFLELLECNETKEEDDIDFSERLRVPTSFVSYSSDCNRFLFLLSSFILFGTLRNIKSDDILFEFYF